MQNNNETKMTLTIVTVGDQSDIKFDFEPGLNATQNDDVRYALTVALMGALGIKPTDATNVVTNQGTLDLRPSHQSVN